MSSIAPSKATLFLLMLNESLCSCKRCFEFCVFVLCIYLRDLRSYKEATPIFGAQARSVLLAETTEVSSTLCFVSEVIWPYLLSRHETTAVSKFHFGGNILSSRQFADAMH